MSQRTALRLGVIGALLADSVLGPMLSGRVYDSRLAAFQSTEFVPALLVYTEDDEGPAFSSNGGPDFNRTCELTIEIAIRAIDADGDVAIPATDGEMEAVLDQIEDRIVGSKDDLANPGIFMAGNDYARALRRHVMRRLAKVSSSRFVDDTTGEKYAVRIVAIAVELLTSGNEKFAPDGLDPPFSALPVSLQAMAACSPPWPQITGTLMQIANRLVAPATPTPFQALGFVLEVATSGQPAPTAPSPDANAPQFTATPDQP